MSAYTAIAARLHSSAGVQRLAGGIAAAHRALQMLPSSQPQRSLSSGRAVLAAIPAVQQAAVDGGSGSFDASPSGALSQLRARLPEDVGLPPSAEAERRSGYSIQASALPDRVHSGQGQQQRPPADIQVDAEHEQHPHRAPSGRRRMSRSAPRTTA